MEPYGTDLEVTKLIDNFTALVVGNSGSGKTQYVIDILKHGHEMMNDPSCLNNILFYYAEDQPLYQEFRKHPMGKRIKWFKENPTRDEIYEEINNQPFTLVIIDDYGLHLQDDLVDIFNVGRNRGNISFIMIIHNLFHEHPIFRNLNRQVKYLFVYNFPRDKKQYHTLAQQITPGNTKWFIEGVEATFQKPFSPSVMDLSGMLPPIFLLRDTFLPSYKNAMGIYVDANLNIHEEMKRFESL